MVDHMNFLKKGGLLPPSATEVFASAMGAEIGAALADTAEKIVNGSALKKDGVNKKTTTVM